MPRKYKPRKVPQLTRMLEQRGEDDPVAVAARDLIVTAAGAEKTITTRDDLTPTRIALAYYMNAVWDRDH